jgi:hypothetical protein
MGAITWEITFIIAASASAHRKQPCQLTKSGRLEASSALDEINDQDDDGNYE